MKRRGYYDQALSGARTLGEIANLFALFVADAKQLDTWKTIDEKQRRREFSAVRVRLTLEQLNAPIPVDEARYGTLSSYSIYADANSMLRWGVQLAAHLSESKAWEIYRERQRRFASLIGDRDPIVLHKEIPGMGRAKRYIITIASDDRAPLDKLCQRLIAVGVTCDVLRNRFGQTDVRDAHE